MSTVSERREAPSLDEPTIDVELIGDSTETALLMQLGTSTREDINTRTPILIGHLQQLLAEEMGADKDETVGRLFHEAYRLLDLKTRPAPDATTFAAYVFMREVASLTRRFLWLYMQRSWTGVA
ncbi:hypothetical protein E3E14_30690 [Streptomyces sp. ICN441]|uniref:hypothetical protein n=1 Tax=Streptomyces sp. ICN441 TaxID=2558286 RepID=UPI00106CD60D|nr:hypothetical protein [Streptomyces sp. ICN441]TFE36172.1 hypothetical protein E3E14_30690 [Streptomyces sp. ICN441]